MFEIGWTELLVIGVVALIVIGPRDLPEMFRQLGRFTAKMRGMARDFQRAMDQAANETGLKDVARDLKAAGSLKSTGLNAVKDAATKFEKWDPIKNAARPSAPAATLATASATAVGPETQALRDAQAQRQAIVAETTERLRAVAARSAAAAEPPAMAGSAAEKPARKPRVKAVPAKDPAAKDPATKAASKSPDPVIRKPRKAAAAPDTKPDTKPRTKADKA